MDIVQLDTNVKYGVQMARVIAKHMCAFNEMNQNMSHKHHSLIQTYNLNAGLKQFRHKVTKLQFAK
jgi:hypothetical protein